MKHQEVSKYYGQDCSLLSHYDFEINDSIVFSYLKMGECNSIETTNIYSNLSDQTKIRLNVINKIKDYLNSKIQERKIMSKRLSKYIAAFDYFEKTLFSISATNGGWTIISFVNVIRAPVGLASANFSLVFSLTTGIIKKLLSKTRNKKEKH